MIEAEIALARASGKPSVADAIAVAGPFDAATIMHEGCAVANPAEPLVRRLREVNEDADEGATSQDVVDTAMMLVANSARTLILEEVDGIAADVILLGQTEGGEVSVPAGGSTAMAHKRNPASAVVAVAAARQVTPRIDLAGEHERAAGAWQAEWPAVTSALAYTGGAAAATRETLAGLEVDAERMRANISPELAGYPPASDALVDRALAAYGQA